MALRPADDEPVFTCKTCKQVQPLSAFYETPVSHRHKCKTCICRKRKERYYADPESHIAYSTKWNQEHRDRHNAYHRASYRRNKDTARERLRRWRKENPEKWLAQQRRAAAVEKRRGHPNAQKRRALMFDAFVEHVDKRVVYEVSEGKCGICDQPVTFTEATLDHIMPLSRGGKHAYVNIQLAHGSCNRRKSNKLPHELDEEGLAA